MTRQIDKLEQLSRLRATGALTDAEFESEKANILAVGDGEASPEDNPPGGGGKVGHWLLAIAVLCFLAIGAFAIGRMHGTPEQFAEAMNEQEPSAFLNEYDLAPAAAEGEYVPATPAETPPPDYLRLCIFGGFSPLGARLGTFADFLVEQGRRISWERVGSDWLLRSRWRDPLTGVDQEEAYQFVRSPGAKPAAGCDGPMGELELERVARNGFERRELDPALAPILHADKTPPVPTEPDTGASSDMPQEGAEATDAEM